MSSAGGWSFDDLVEDEHSREAEVENKEALRHKDVREENSSWNPPPYEHVATHSEDEASHEDYRSNADQQDAPPSPQDRHYAPRTCRICLEEVFPTLEPVAEGLGARFNPRPKVSYISSDPSSGRLIRPCKCRGSQKYVHEGCLQEWRHADPSYGRRTYFECPTCKFQYRLERIRWSQWLTSTTLQIAITAGIMFLTIFVFGFIADPIINLYLDPFDTVTTTVTGQKMPAITLDAENESWFFHFTKGLASLGLLGFVKVFFAMSPWQWWNMRQGGLLGGTRRAARGRQGGRERLENISWTVVVIGVITFLFAVWSWVRAWTLRTLENAGEKVADVQGDEDEEEEVPPQPAAAAGSS